MKKLMKKAEKTLQKTFGHEEFRARQKQAIKKIFNRKDVFYIDATGTGKSICYQIPALCLDGLCIVISPTIALMEEQVLSLKNKGIRAETINSSNFGNRKNVLDLVKENEIDLLYMAPETALKKDVLSVLKKVNICLLAIDEAHCISGWGHSFRKDYLKLNQLKDKLNADVPCIILTATADETTKKDIVKQLKIAPHIITGTLYRPEISIKIQKKDGNGIKQLIRFLKKQPKEDSGIIYCTRKKDVNDVCKKLKRNGLNAYRYHSEVSNKEKKKTQRTFQEEACIVVATNAFGMGMNKPDVRFVIHMGIPLNIEAYYQEIGRAGRDGKSAQAVMFCNNKDVSVSNSLLRNKKDNEVKDSSECHKFKQCLREKFQIMLGLCETDRCKWQVINEYLDEEIEKCERCNSCKGKFKTYKKTKVAKKIIECINELGTPCGTNRIIKILCGEEAENKYSKLKSFGSCREIGEEKLRSTIRQMIIKGYLFIDLTRFGVLEAGEIPKKVMMRKSFLIKPKQSKKAILKELDDKLLSKLKKLRKRIANTDGVPACKIFSDKALKQMAIQKPSTKKQALSLKIMNEKKHSQHGQFFINYIKRCYPV
ncbi:MAG: ATP-dependent DNA helicase RecQ [Alphaproteobacteria bacterium]|nr:ATP-dependent DNA helicase RecQ [Alphaproteobacteria bacterium]